MSTKGGFNYTTFQGVNLRTSAGISFEMDGGFRGTVSVTASPDANRKWSLPDKDGKFPIMGTFTVDLPAALANIAVYSTAVTVAGIRAEDALVVNFLKESGTYTYGATTTRYILNGAVPGNGNITLHFQNLGQGTGYLDDLQFAYLATR